MSQILYYRKSVGLKIWVITAVFVLSLSLFYPLEVNAQDDYYYRDFEWDYDGSTWTLSLSIPKYLYEDYKSVPVSTRLQHQTSGYGFLTTTNDAYLQMVAEKLEEASSEKGYGSYDEVSFVLAFIQSLPYTSDSVISGYDEYPRFPIETLVDNGGDCEDTSILFATLTLIMGYGTVYINPPDHYAVGVLGKDLPGFYYTYNDRTYYYCETTGDGWKIGEIPSEFKDEKVHIYAIREYQQYVPESWFAPSITPTPSPSPSPSPSPTTTPTPTPEPQPGLFLPVETLFIMRAIITTAIILIIFIALRKRK